MLGGLSMRDDEVRFKQIAGTLRIKVIATAMFFMQFKNLKRCAASDRICSNVGILPIHSKASLYIRLDILTCLCQVSVQFLSSNRSHKIARFVFKRAK